MNGVESLPAWAAVAVALLLILGAGITLIGALGLVRLPTFYQRMHAPAIIVSLGAGSILVASMLYFSVLQSRPVIHEMVIIVFILMTAPVVAMLVMRTAVYRDLRGRKADAGIESGDVYRIPPIDEPANPTRADLDAADPGSPH